jgi:hypothetical protein
MTYLPYQMRSLNEGNTFQNLHFLLWIVINDSGYVAVEASERWMEIADSLGHYNYSNETLRKVYS